MSQNTRTRGLVVVTILAIIVLLMGFLTLGDEQATYKISAAEALLALEEEANTIGLDQAKELVVSGEDQVLVDLRTLVEFNQGHLDGAISVPFADLLTEASQALFLERESKHFLLYGKSASQASNAWMMLRQVGLEQVKFIPGAYDLVANTVEEVPLDVAAHDYQAVFEKVQNEELESISVGKPIQPKPAPKLIIPEKKPKKRRLEGC
ncbi:MAG TPA: rhodanese-like domain-containing protein [Saprospiraceae bacterium]|nr:rhodanese-like domain-containing protein [Saprospiraceae bacterium]